MRNVRPENKPEADLIEPDYLIRHWMVPYLPKSHTQRDIVMLIACMVFTLLIVLLIWPMAGDVISIGLMSLVAGYFLQRYTYRPMRRNWAKKNSEQI
jgi:1,4-dihydroxy-2-naphthoate octaprenyltransferase